MNPFRFPKFVGMVHLLPLPGSPGFRGSFSEVLDAALMDATHLEKGGVDAIMIENFGDIPFFPGSVPPHVIASITKIAVEISRTVKSPLGINVLRNDGIAALSVANAVGAAFIRVNVLTGARVTDQGIISGNAAEIMRLRSELGSSVQVMADVDVKHSAPLATFSFDDEVADTVDRGLADAIIVSGKGTGKAPSTEKVAAIRKVCKKPLYIGSGADLRNIHEFSGLVDGFIIGSALKSTNDIRSAVDVAKVKTFCERIGDR